jgi:rare lipoprotein A
VRNPILFFLLASLDVTVKTNVRGGNIRDTGAIGNIVGLSIALAVICATNCHAAGGFAMTPRAGEASWYGEQHRGLLMANGKKFNPDKLTAASWFYPLGTRLKVTRISSKGTKRSVIVTVTDRGPADRLVARGRIIDLSHAAFKQLAVPSQGLVQVQIQQLPTLLASNSRR